MSSSVIEESMICTMSEALSAEVAFVSTNWNGSNGVLREESCSYFLSGIKILIEFSEIDR